MPRRYTFFQQVRGRAQSIVLDGGDAFFASPGKKAMKKTRIAGVMRNARTILHAYNYMGYHGMGLGPGDLQFGVDELKSFLKSAKFPIICSNLVEKATGKTVFEKTKVITVGGVRFGVYGVILDSINRGYKARVLGEKYDLLNALDTTKKVVAELRPNCDVLIGLSHVNMIDNKKISNEVKGIDVILDPYSQYGNKAVWVTEGE
ncbi:MAG: hypothetical protein AAF517_21395, partial [Planctomycetota bacterium]